jgi:LacI family transcriptional regulator
MVQKKVSIKDVAKASGVSVATVSRIINNTGRFSQETQKRVIKIIDELGYEQNRLAVGLRSNQSNTIGILVPDITNEFYAAIVKKCEQWLFSHGYSSIICNTERSREREKAYIQVLTEHRVDGLIVISTTDAGNGSGKTDGMPTVFIDRDPHTLNETIVASDHYRGGKIITNFLLDHNLSPYLIMTKTKTSSTMERVRAFKEILANHKITNIDSRICVLDVTSDKFLQPSQQLDRYLKAIFEKEKQAGIFGINDNVAYMIIQAAQRLSIDIPKQLSVIGFDGSSFSEISVPRITTIVQDTTRIADSACVALINKIENKGISKKGSNVIKIPVRLCVKESTI